MNVQDPELSTQTPAGIAPAFRDRVVDAMVVVLRDGIDVHRCAAARALGEVGGAMAVAGLTQALLDEDEDVRSDAAAALARLADPAAAGQLLENLIGDPNYDVKKAAIDGLARMGASEVVPWLRRMMAGRDQEILWDEEDFYDSEWDDWTEIQVKAIEALADMGDEDSVPAIVAATTDEDAQDLCAVTFAALAKLGTPGAEALLGFLDDRDLRRRRRAVAALAGQSGAAATDALLRALGDAAWDVRLEAGRALASRLPDEPRVVALMNDPAPEVRRTMTGLLGAHHPEQLLARLDDPDEGVQQAALAFWAQHPTLLPGAALTETLVARLRHPDSALAASAVEALAAAAPREDAIPALTALLDERARTEEVRLAALKALVKLRGTDLMPDLVSLLDDDQRPARLEAMAAIVRLAATDVTWPNASGAALLSVLRGEHVAAREAEALSADQAASGEPSPEDPLGSHAEDEIGAGEADQIDEGGTEAGGPFPTSTLAAILGGEGEATRTETLAAAEVELSEDDLEFLALARGRHGKKRVPLTPAVAAHEDVRLYAARLAGDLARQEVADSLVELLDGTDQMLRLAAADSLGRIGTALGGLPDGAEARLVAKLKETDRDLRLACVRALAAGRAATMALAVIACLRDRDGFVRAAAIHTLMAVGETGAGFDRFLEDPEPGVRLAAAEAMADQGGDEVLAALHDFAFAFDGFHHRQAARLLRRLDPGAAIDRFLAVIEDSQSGKSPRIALESLEELIRSSPQGSAAPLA